MISEPLRPVTYKSFVCITLPYRFDISSRTWATMDFHPPLSVYCSDKLGQAVPQPDDNFPWHIWYARKKNYSI